MDGLKGVALERVRCSRVVCKQKLALDLPLQDLPWRRVAAEHGLALLLRVIGLGFCGRLIQSGDGDERWLAEDVHSLVPATVVSAPGREDAVKQDDVEVIELPAVGREPPPKHLLHGVPVIQDPTPAFGILENPPFVPPDAEHRVAGVPIVRRKHPCAGQGPGSGLVGVCTEKPRLDGDGRGHAVAEPLGDDIRIRDGRRCAIQRDPFHHGWRSVGPRKTRSGQRPFPRGPKARGMVDAREYHQRTNHDPEKLRTMEFRPDEDLEPRPYKLYRGVETEPLPRIRVPNGPTLAAVAESARDPVLEGASRCATLDRETIATLCYAATGVLTETAHNGETVRFRAASCTGKLYHVDCYLVVGERPDLPAGVYHFDPRRCRLNVLRRGDLRGTLAAAGGADADHPIARAPVTIVGTSTWWRNAWKYRARAYRHAFWDLGTIWANLLASAHSVDQPARVETAFADDAVVDLLGIDPSREIPIAAATIGDGDPSPAAVEPPAIDPTIEPPSPETISYPLIPDAWAQSSLADGTAAAEWRTTVQEGGPIRPGVEPAGERIDLDPVDHERASARPLMATIRRRGSKRAFDDSGPTRRQLGTILDRAMRGVPADWNGGEADELAYVVPFVLTTGVDGVPDGTYRYDSGADQLVRINDADRETTQHLALGQPWAGDAHVNVYLMAPVDPIVERLGNRGYRLAQLEAGVTLGRLYLATAAHRELGGTGLTFFDRAVQDHLDGDTTDRWPMTLFAFGRVDSGADSRI